MSPLIDCVFLLLIFFLVTTMIKRKEKLIPIQLPSMDSSVSQKTHESFTILGLNRDGSVSEGCKNTYIKSRDLGKVDYFPIGNLEAWLREKKQSLGRDFLQKPLRIDADREVGFQTAIDMIDVLKLNGFTDVGIKTKLRAKGDQP